MSEIDSADTIKAQEDGQSDEGGFQGVQDPKLNSAFAAKRRAEEERDAAVAKAKEAEAEVQRLKNSPDAPVLRGDLHKINERQAKEELAKSESEDDKDIIENLDAILPYYTPRAGKETKEAIMRDLRTARVAYRYENPKKDTTSQDATRALQEGAQRGKGSPAPKATVSNPLEDRFAKRGGPDSWYPEARQSLKEKDS